MNGREHPYTGDRILAGNWPPKVCVRNKKERFPFLRLLFLLLLLVRSPFVLYDAFVAPFRTHDHPVNGFPRPPPTRSAHVRAIRTKRRSCCRVRVLIVQKNISFAVIKESQHFRLRAKRHNGLGSFSFDLIPRCFNLSNTSSAGFSA